MSRKHKNMALKLLNFLSLVLLVHTLSAAARSVQRPTSPEEKDPMMALPSGRSEQQEVQYVTYQPTGPYTMAQAAEPGTRQELVEEYQSQPQVQAASEAQPEQQYEVVQVQQPSVNEEDCNQRHEYTALLDQRPQYVSTGEQSVSPEYAGQLVYMSQGRNQANGLKGGAASWSQASDLSATILTEIPVKEMPVEVLRKLRRDYGVKVVATRERPGANLVINCDEYSGQENSICNRHLASHETAYQSHPSERPQLEMVEPMVMAPRQGPVSSFQHVEHIVQPTSEPSHVYVQEGPTESYQTSEDSRAASVEQSRPVEEGEQATYEVATPATSNTNAADHETEQHENNRENSHGQSSSSSAGHQTNDEEHGDEQGETATAYDQSAPVRGQESQEQSAGFEEQRNEHDAHWRDSSSGDEQQQAPRRDYVKQIDSSETNSAPAAHQTSR